MLHMKVAIGDAVQGSCDRGCCIKGGCDRKTRELLTRTLKLPPSSYLSISLLTRSCHFLMLAALGIGRAPLLEQCMQGAVSTWGKASWRAGEGNFRVCVSARLPGTPGHAQGIWPAGDCG
jgi:hypothetical protein